MEQSKRVVVDLTGADFPEEIIEGVLLAIQKGIPGEQLIGICDESLSAYDKESLMQHGMEIICAEKPPTDDENQRKETPIWKGISMLLPAAELQAGAFVSAGNTKTVVTSAVKLLFRLRDRIKAWYSFRPAIAVQLPYAEHCIIADIGANLVLRGKDYMSLALLCCAYVETVLGIKNPGIHILNVGTEESKATEQVKEANQLLRKSGLNYLGYAEGGKVAKPDPDTNIILSEAQVFNPLIKFWEAWTGRGEEIGGCPLLGTPANIFIAHGASSRVAFCNAIFGTIRLVESGINAAIQQKLCS